MNDFSKIPSETEFRQEMTVQPDELAPDAFLEQQYEDRTHVENDETHEFEDPRMFPGEDEPATGWPGDGSGMDDLADYNANEADDYRDEG